MSSSGTRWARQEGGWHESLIKHVGRWKAQRRPIKVGIAGSSPVLATKIK